MYQMKELDTNPLKEGKSLNLPASGSAEVVFVVQQLEKDGDQLQLRMHHSTLGDQGIVVKLDKEGLEVVAKWLAKSLRILFTFYSGMTPKRCDASRAVQSQQRCAFSLTKTRLKFLEIKADGRAHCIFQAN